MAGTLSRFVGVALFFLAMFAAPAAAVDNNFILLSQTHVPAPRIRQYSDCWSFRNPSTGKEYAVLGTMEGVSIWNITDPFNPTQVAFYFGVTQNPWRDVTVWNNHVYAVSQGIGTGMQIVDITNPDAPILRPTFGSFTARNFLVDPTTSIGYAIGWHPTSEDQAKDDGDREVLAAARGFHAWDMSNPESPDSILEYVFPYFHDAVVRNGKLYGGAINEGGRFDIVRVSNLPATNTVATVTYPSGRSHGTALSDNSAYCYVADELSSLSGVRVFDISDTSDIIQVANMPGVAGTSVHNVSVLRDTLYCSWYEAGVRLYDVRNPLSPVFIGNYDTGPDTAGIVQGHTGCWGVCPKLNSGVIVASDMLQGMILLYHTELIGTISGTVTVTGWGSPLAGAQIKVIDFFDRRATTNASGVYSGVALPGGMHTVVASKYGFMPDTAVVNVLDGQNSVLNFQLDPITGISPGGAASQLALADPMPNPAPEGSTLTFELPRESAVTLVLYDVSGRAVRTIASGVFPVGRHAVRWDGRDDQGRNVASGAFVARLSDGRDVRSTRVVLTR
jgi:choice-of-anchor B domain-containing protein